MAKSHQQIKCPTAGDRLPSTPRLSAVTKRDRFQAFRPPSSEKRLEYKVTGSEPGDHVPRTDVRVCIWKTRRKGMENQGGQLARRGTA